uniref:Uncharacterized protein n=1 Tax=Oryza brachyantha TaxID=4533 RepID=J3MNH6_ORYBR
MAWYSTLLFEKKQRKYPALQQRLKGALQQSKRGILLSSTSQFQNQKKKSLHMPSIFHVQTSLIR